MASMAAAPSQDHSPTETITRRRHFAQVPDDLVVDPRLSDRAVRVWVRLDKYAGKNGDAFPSRERLAGDLGCSMPSITRALSELVAAGWITRSPRVPGGVWNTTLNDVSTNPSSVLIRPLLTGDETPDQDRAGEGHPPKDTKEGHGSTNTWACEPRGEGASPRRRGRLRGPITKDEVPAAWSRLKSLCEDSGDEPYNVWYTLLSRGAMDPSAFMADLVDRGNWDGYAARHGIDEYNADGSVA